TAGVLNVQGAHMQNTPQDDRVAIRLVQNQIQVLNGPNNEMVKSFDRDQVKAIDILMSGGNNALVDLTGLGKLSGDAPVYTKADAGTADVRYLNQAGNKVRQWDALSEGRHHKVTTMANGDKVDEASWDSGKQHFVTVDTAKGRAVTGQMEGDKFVVTTEIRG